MIIRKLDRWLFRGGMEMEFCSYAVLRLCGYAVLQLGYPVRDNLSVEKKSCSRAVVQLLEKVCWNYRLGENILKSYAVMQSCSLCLLYTSDAADE